MEPKLEKDAIAAQIIFGITKIKYVLHAHPLDVLKDKLKMHKKISNNVEQINFIIKTVLHVLVVQRFQIQTGLLKDVDAFAIQIINGIYILINV